MSVDNNNRPTTMTPGNGKGTASSADIKPASSPAKEAPPIASKITPPVLSSQKTLFLDDLTNSASPPSQAQRAFAIGKTLTGGDLDLPTDDEIDGNDKTVFLS